jgi:hypothetical protein
MASPKRLNRVVLTVMALFVISRAEMQGSGDRGTPVIPPAQGSGITSHAKLPSEKWRTSRVASSASAGITDWSYRNRSVAGFSSEKLAGGSVVMSATWPSISKPAGAAWS